MELIRRIGWRRGLLACVLVSFPFATYARPQKESLPIGICDSPQHMAEAARAGRAMVDHVLSIGMPWSDDSLNEYVNRLGQNLARSSGSRQVFTFYVLYNPEVNAEAFPGGYVVVNSGAISTAENEAELASVLSHEIAHANACDCQARRSKADLFELLAVAPALALAGPAAIALTAGSGWAASVVHARASRAKESRADRLATLYLARAGYDPRATVSMLERLEASQARHATKSDGLLATHPRVSERREKLMKILPSLPPPEVVPHDETEFRRVQKAVRDYDEIYSRVTGVRVPGREPLPPVLDRRPPRQTSP